MLVYGRMLIVLLLAPEQKGVNWCYLERNQYYCCGVNAVTERGSFHFASWLLYFRVWEQSRKCPWMLTDSGVAQQMLPWPSLECSLFCRTEVYGNVLWHMWFGVTGFWTAPLPAEQQMCAVLKNFIDKEEAHFVYVHEKKENLFIVSNWNFNNLIQEFT